MRHYPDMDSRRTRVTHHRHRDALLKTGAFCDTPDASSRRYRTQVAWRIFRAVRHAEDKVEAARTRELLVEMETAPRRRLTFSPSAKCRKLRLLTAGAGKLID